MKEIFQANDFENVEFMEDVVLKNWASGDGKYFFSGKISLDENNYFGLSYFQEVKGSPSTLFLGTHLYDANKETIIRTLTGCCNKERLENAVKSNLEMFEKILNREATQ